MICAAAFLASFVPAPQVQGPESRMHPVTAPIHRIEATLERSTGRLVRKTGVALGSGGFDEVYDNTCPSAFFFGLEPQGGQGGAFPQAIGDFGSLPSDQFAGDDDCTPGCASSYEIAEFEIAWCTAASSPGGSTIELYFWDPPLPACTTGDGPFGGTIPPTTPETFNVVLTGLPQTNTAGTLACYTLSIELDEPFTLGATDAFMTGDFNNPGFAWSFQIPTSTGLDGPILSGDLTPFASPCAPCEGTLFETGGQTTNAGTGAGQSTAVFIETFGSSDPLGSGDCFFFGSTAPSGVYLELFAEDACAPPIGTAFCDGSDGSLEACPCANPGDLDTGCDVQQGTGGVRLDAVAQQVTPKNRVTLEGNGFPPSSNPTAIVIRAPDLDVGGPAVFGDGVRCVAATVVRMSATFASGGSSVHTLGHGAGPGDFFYQLWFRNLPAMFCTPDAFNASSGRALTW